MHPAKALIALAALPLLGGCYSYDVSATNAADQPVRVSLVKGKYDIHLTDVVLEPGASASWSGQTNGPVFMRVGSQFAGDPVEIQVPRREHTDFTIDSAGAGFRVFGPGPGVAASQSAPAPAPAPGADAPPAGEPQPIVNTYENPPAAPATAKPAPAAEPAAEPPATDPPPVDLIEDGDG